jgi:hypothetical protein
MDDRAAAEEEERLEERVGHQVERACGVRPDSHRGEHVPELRYGRVRQHALDVVLHESNGGGHQRRQHANDRDNLHDHRRVREEHGVATHHVDARRDHRRGVNQCGDRSRAFHRVGEPHVQRNLCALASGADEEKHANEGENAKRHRLDRHAGGQVLDLAEVERAEGEEDEKDAEDEAPVTDAIGDERLLARIRRALLLVPVTDQQVRAQAHAFPAHEHHQEIAAQDEHEHEEAEQIEVAEESRETAARLLGHVRRRIHMDQGADPGDDENHHPGKRIEAESPLDVQPANPVCRRKRGRRNPVRQHDLVRACVGRQAE